MVFPTAKRASDRPIPRGAFPNNEFKKLSKVSTPTGNHPSEAPRGASKHATMQTPTQTRRRPESGRGLEGVNGASKAGSPGAGVPSSKKGVTRRGAGGLVTSRRGGGPASTAATIARQIVADAAPVAQVRCAPGSSMNALNDSSRKTHRTVLRQ